MGGDARGGGGGEPGLGLGLVWRKRDGTLMLRDALQAKGYAVHHWENQSHLHDFIRFGERFNKALGYLFPP